MHALYRARAVTTEEMVYEVQLLADRMRAARERTDDVVEQVRRLMVDELGYAPTPRLRLVGSELGPDDGREK
jgi:hypothetical protein